VPESSSSTDHHVIGRLGRPHGLDGHLGLYLDESDIDYFGAGSVVLVDGVSRRVHSIRRSDKGFQVRFEGITTRPKAEKIRGAEIAVSERRQLSDDEFWPEDLVGLDVRLDDATTIGKVVGVVTTSAQDRLSIEVDDVVYDVPFVAELVPVIDKPGGFIVIDPIPGLTEPLA
jgi:16S rRNA processing protein RimM